MTKIAGGLGGTGATDAGSIGCRGGTCCGEAACCCILYGPTCGGAFIVRLVADIVCTMVCSARGSNPCWFRKCLRNPYGLPYVWPHSLQMRYSISLGE